MTKRVPVLDIIVGLLLSAFGIILVSNAERGTPWRPKIVNLRVSGAVKGNARHAGVAACLFVLLMTLPVAWRSRALVVVAAVLAAGAILNPLIIGDMIRCGPALPALLLCAYTLGRQAIRLSRAVTGLALGCLLVSAVVQCLTDPNLQLVVMVALAPMIFGIYAAGRLVTSGIRKAAELQQRNEQLRLQRARRAELAVQADRARIAEGLDTDLNSRITEMEAVAAEGRLALDRDHSAASAQAAFGVIQERGRDTLTRMRHVVGTLLEPDPLQPQPGLSQLDQLLARAGRSDVLLHVSGRPRPLPAGVQVSVYRTLETLLDAYGDVPGSRIDVDVDYSTEALTLTVRGPAPDEIDVQSALAAARARVAVHGGSLVSDFPAGRWEATARLPV